jgi:methylmalonyl-CoA/ethylmalonyl-CoA epimerase
MLKKLGCVFHHLGVACRDLEQEAPYWLSLGYVTEGADFEDPIQRVRGRFLVGPGPRLELLQGVGDDSPIAGLLKRQIKLYHQAFETPMFDLAVRTLEESGARLTAPPAPAVAFGGRRIAFLFLPNGNILELVETLE